MPNLRAVAPLEEGPKKLQRSPIPPPPKISWLPLSQLVVDETYQRDLSKASLRLIRRLVERWDWNMYKPLSVAASAEGLYEVIDGQHTAIAAATHGAIELLPCLVLDAATVAERSAAFVGINRDRIGLTPFALFRARLGAEDPEAVAVQQALEQSGAQLLESLRYDVDYPPGTVACVSTLLQIVRRGGRPRLARLLKIAKAADIGPVPSALLKGLEEVVAGNGSVNDADLIEILSELGGEDLVDRANQRRKMGLAPTVNDAAAQVIWAALDKEAA